MVPLYEHCVTGSILFIYPTPDLSAEDEIVHKIAEMSVKLQHIDSLNDQRKLDLQVSPRLCLIVVVLKPVCCMQGISLQFGSLLKLVKDQQDQHEDSKSPLNKKLAEYSKQGINSPDKFYMQHCSTAVPSLAQLTELNASYWLAL